MKFLLLLILISCGKPVEEYQPSIKDNLLDENGNCIVNIGHRIGGDLREFEDNTIKGFLGILDYENHECFKIVEFDIVSAKDDIVLNHDKTYKGKVVSKNNSYDLGLDLLRDLLFEIEASKIDKKIFFDFKHVNETHQKEILSLAIVLSSNFRVFFITHEERKTRYKEIFQDAIENGLGIGYYN